MRRGISNVSIAVTLNPATAFIAFEIPHPINRIREDILRSKAKGLIGKCMNKQIF